MTSLKRKKLPNGAATDRSLLFHAMYLMASIDGGIAPEEAAVLRALLGSLPDFRTADVDLLMTEAEARAKKYGGLIDSIEAFTELSAGSDVRYRAFLLAVEVAYASGTINPAEEQLLDTLGAILGLDEGVRDGIVGVLAFKYAT